MRNVLPIILAIIIFDIIPYHYNNKEYFICGNANNRIACNSKQNIKIIIDNNSAFP